MDSLPRSRRCEFLPRFFSKSFRRSLPPRSVFFASWSRPASPRLNAVHRLYSSSAAENHRFLPFFPCQFPGDPSVQRPSSFIHFYTSENLLWECSTCNYSPVAALALRCRRSRETRDIPFGRKISPRLARNFILSPAPLPPPSFILPTALLPSAGSFPLIASLAIQRRIREISSPVIH